MIVGFLFILLIVKTNRGMTEIVKSYINAKVSICNYYKFFKLS